MSNITKHLWDKAGRERIPLTGSFELLPACNLSCKMCYVRKSWKEVEAEGGLLPAEFWLQLADEAMKEGLLYPLLTGGEPFLREDFQEILDGLLKRGLQVSINTNGTLIDEKMARWLNEHRTLRLNLTLYGASAESYQKLCGNGAAFEKVQKAVQYLKKYNLPVKFNTSITKYNVNDLEAMMSYAKSVESPIEVAAYMFPPVRRDASMIGENDRLSPEEAGYIKVRSDYLQKDADWFLAQVKRYQYFQPLTEQIIKEAERGEGKEISCRAGRCAFWVDWKGNMANCGMYAATGVDMKKIGFQQAWKEIVEKTNRVIYSPVCSNCPNHWLCHACIAMVYNESGSQNGRPEYICQMTEAAAGFYKLYAELLEKGKDPLQYTMEDLQKGVR